jgi:glycosyltransferase involved in cell wall biosynthesis
MLKVPNVLRASSYRPLHNDFAGVARKLDSRLVERLEALQFRLSRNIFSPSHSLQKTLAGHAKLNRVRVIPTPFFMETSEWDRSVYERDLKGKRYLLFFGRFELRKGFHVLAQALPLFLDRYPEAHVVLVGRDMKSALAPSMAEYARSFCSSSPRRVTFIDRLPHSQLYPVIDGAHLVALPSLVDNFPNACLEAMALGKPVIGTFGASFDELISDEESGFLVAAGEVAALGEKLIYAWSHHRLQEIGQAAQQKMLQFLPEKTVARLLTYYREVLEPSA